MAGYSGTPLIKKLGIKEGDRLRPVQAPAHYFHLLELPAGVKVISKGEADVIHLFVKAAKDIGKLDRLKDEVKKDGMIWVSWEKKKAKEKDAANENKVRDKALAIGLVDIKVCAVDEDWSGLKLVWRKEKRG